MSNSKSTQKGKPSIPLDRMPLTFSRVYKKEDEVKRLKITNETAECIKNRSKMWYSYI